MNVTGKVKPKRRNRSESESEKGVKLAGIDAKRDDLPMARLKVG